jgi:hypothetical protein
LTAAPVRRPAGLQTITKCRYKGRDEGCRKNRRALGDEGYGMAIRRDNRAILRGAQARSGAALLCILLLSRP